MWCGGAAECDVEVCGAKAGRKVRWWRVMGHGRWSEEVDEVGRERWWRVVRVRACERVAAWRVRGVYGESCVRDNCELLSDLVEVRRKD